MSIKICCHNCAHSQKPLNEYPCSECDDNLNRFMFKQPTKPPRDEEINHPSRYAGGKFECIEVMADVFGKEAVKDFCLLNAFKYIWRQEKKGGVEDVKKAVWYLNKYIELSDSHENV